MPKFLSTLFLMLILPFSSVKGDLECRNNKFCASLVYNDESQINEWLNQRYSSQFPPEIRADMEILGATCSVETDSDNIICRASKMGGVCREDKSLIFNKNAAPPVKISFQQWRACL